ncbi:hypothetical protein L596_027101 [Steinernema carpocapsae]|uniref:Uncharacterized protein n=1 Tax=Steinernema carpocapsae TaxID=34508 RepID=A0A4U5M3H0_STECR|nr:hypothetical protein L596_027101 [Steinernema carpocapsae]
MDTDPAHAAYLALSETENLLAEDQAPHIKEHLERDKALLQRLLSIERAPLLQDLIDDRKRRSLSLLPKKIVIDLYRLNKVLAADVDCLKGTFGEAASERNDLACLSLEIIHDIVTQRGIDRNNLLLLEGSYGDYAREVRDYPLVSVSDSLVVFKKINELRGANIRCVQIDSNDFGLQGLNRKERIKTVRLALRGWYRHLLIKCQNDKNVSAINKVFKHSVRFCSAEKVILNINEDLEMDERCPNFLLFLMNVLAKDHCHITAWSEDGRIKLTSVMGFHPEIEAFIVAAFHSGRISSLKCEKELDEDELRPFLTFADVEPKYDLSTMKCRLRHTYDEDGFELFDSFMQRNTEATLIRQSKGSAKYTIEKSNFHVQITYGMYVRHVIIEVIKNEHKKKMDAERHNKEERKKKEEADDEKPGPSGLSLETEPKRPRL